MNRERLQQVRDRIAAEPPENLRMSKYHCGTAHCIAGWAVTLFPDEGSIYAEMGDIELGLKPRQGDALFTPPEYHNPGAYTQADALAALDSLINADSDDALPVWPEPRA